MIVDCAVMLDASDNFTIKCTTYRGSEGLLEIFMRKYVNTELINKNDLNMFKKYLNDYRSF